MLTLLSFVSLNAGSARADTEVEQLVNEFNTLLLDGNTYSGARKSAEALRDLGIERNDRDLEIRGLIRMLYAEVRYGQWNLNCESTLKKCSTSLESGGSVVAAEVLMFRGHLKGKWLGDLEGGIADLNESIFIANRLRRDRLTSLAYAHASELLIFDNSYDRARDYAFRALEISERAGDASSTIYSLFRLLCAMEIKRESVDAAPYARQLLTLDPTSMTARKVLFLAGENPQFDQQLMERIEQLQDGASFPPGAVAHCQVLLAEIRRNQKRFPEALELATAARDEFAAVKNWVEMRIADYTLALIRLQMGEDVDIEHLIEVVEDEDKSVRIVYSADKVAKLYEVAGDYETAWEWHRRTEKSQALERSVGAREARNMAKEFWDTEIRTRAEVDRLLARQQNAQFLLFGLSILGFCVLGLAFVVRMRFKMVRRSRDELERQVAERTASLELARKNAEMANAAKGEFLARINHEIRNPLTAILGYCELMELQSNSPSTDPTRDRYLAKLRSSSEHLMELVTDVLEVAKIERSRTVPNSEWFSVIELCDDIQELFFESARQSGVTFHCGLVEGSDEMAYTDRTFCSQILVYLLSNAFSATDQGHVTASLRIRPGSQGESSLLIEVSDSGCGIAKADQKRVFEPFVQLPRQTGEGHGLGLHATQSLVSKLGGTLTLQSEPGVGTSVSISVPVGEKRTRLRRRSVAKNLRILVVDDLQEVSEVLCAQLKILGHSTQTCEDLPDILNRIQEWSPNLILLDLRMPKYSGYEILEAIRNRFTSPPPVIAMTGDGTQDVRKKALESGFDGFMAKPFSIAKINQTFQELRLGEVSHAE